MIVMVTVSGSERKVKNQEWPKIFSKSILNERRKFNNKNDNERYKSINKLIIRCNKTEGALNKPSFIRNWKFAKKKQTYFGIAVK